MATIAATSQGWSYITSHSETTPIKEFVRCNNKCIDYALNDITKVSFCLKC